MTRWMIGACLIAASCGDAGSEAPARGEHSPPHAAPAPLPEEAVPDERGRVAVTVDATGYHPGKIHARAGAPITLVFTRISEAGCGEELVFPELGIRRPLPVGQPVEVPVTPAADIHFTCGMDMLRGAIVAHTAATEER